MHRPDTATFPFAKLLTVAVAIVPVAVGGGCASRADAGVASPRIVAPAASFARVAQAPVQATPELPVELTQLVIADEQPQGRGDVEFDVPADAAGDEPPADEAVVRLSPEQLRDLVGPIALYPDPLLAQVLAAATYPLEVVQAARFMREHEGDEAVHEKLDAQPWDPSVLAVARYPSVLFMLDENLDWMQNLGAAFIHQQQDVMDAVQWSRRQAEQAGNLRTTEQQAVVIEEQVIQIVPAEPQVIYVPQYVPEVVYVERVHHHKPAISFGVAFARGPWLHLDCDWRHRRVCFTDKHHHHHHGSRAHAGLHVHVGGGHHSHTDRHRDGRDHAHDRDHHDRADHDRARHDHDGGVAHRRDGRAVRAPWRHDSTKAAPALRRVSGPMRGHDGARPSDADRDADSPGRTPATRPYFRAAPRYDRPDADAPVVRDGPTPATNRRARDESSPARTGSVHIAGGRSDSDGRPIVRSTRDGDSDASVNRPSLADRPGRIITTRRGPDRPVIGPIQRDRGDSPKRSTPRATRSITTPTNGATSPRPVWGPQPARDTATPAARSITPSRTITRSTASSPAARPIQRPSPREAAAARAAQIRRSIRTATQNSRASSSASSAQSRLRTTAERRTISRPRSTIRSRANEGPMPARVSPSRSTPARTMITAPRQSRTVTPSRESSRSAASQRTARPQQRTARPQQQRRSRATPSRSRSERSGSSESGSRGRSRRR